MSDQAATYLHVMGEGWDEFDPLDDRPLREPTWPEEQDRIVKEYRAAHGQPVGFVWTHSCARTPESCCFHQDFPGFGGQR
jgi:hypothetical protein